jgi:hypothetical protein
MKVKTLIKYLEPYKEAEVFFGNDEQGSIFFNNCDIETDKSKVLVYPFGKELVYEKTKLNQVIQVK